MFKDIDYTAGRCHLFAVMLAQHYSLPVTLLFDTEAEDEGFSLIEEPCLVHAYIELGGNVLDIDGLQSPIQIEGNYEANCPEIKRLPPEEVLELAKEKGWPLYISGEEGWIKERIDQIKPSGAMPTLA